MRFALLLSFGLALVCSPALANPLPRLKSLPYDLTLSQAGKVTVEGDKLTLTAPKGTDLYNPTGKPPVSTAPRVTFTPPAGDFVFAFKARTTFGAAYDGPGLVMWNGEDYWAKLLFEHLDGNINVVSSNFATPIGDNSYHTRTDGAVSDIWLKMVRVKNSVFFYASRDGQTWEILRDFTVDPAKPLAIGVFGQAPLGEELTSVFSDIRFEQKTITSYWNGE
jgi:regulation of enolase protein 1 (concanavalin A-like superfamily)